MIEQRKIGENIKVLLLADYTIVIEKKVSAGRSQGISLSCSQAEQVIETMKELIGLRYKKYA